jgi:hypothetical protein
MTRLVWYQHRAALLGLLTVSTALAVMLTAVGVLGRTRPETASGLLPDRVWLITQLVIVVTGMFLGAPLLSREYEQGTFRFAWTQGTSRTRWCVLKLNAFGVLIVLDAAAIGALASWSFRPFSSFPGGRYGRPAEFVTSPATTAGWALLAFMAGVAAGALLKRVVPAAAVTGLTLTVLLALAHTSLRRLLPMWPPLIVPGSRYWLAQAVAGAVLVAAALLLGAATLWLVRSRGARTRGRRPEPG